MFCKYFMWLRCLFEVVIVLLCVGVDLNVVDRLGYILFWWVVMYKCFEFVEVLFVYGVNLFVRIEDG